MKNYFAELEPSSIILWCYLIWYLYTVFSYFDLSLEIWLNAFGICLIVGFALFLSTGPVSLNRIKTRPWESFRLFICPFMVASFSTLIKGKGFFLIFSPHLTENLIACLMCCCFVIFTRALKL